MKVVPAAEASVWDPTPPLPRRRVPDVAADNEPDLPRPFGVMRWVGAPTLDGLVAEQVAAVTAKRGPGKLKDLLYTSDCWTVE